MEPIYGRQDENISPLTELEFYTCSLVYKHFAATAELNMIRPLLVRAPNYCLYLEFCDGVNGEVDLSDLGGEGVFEARSNQTFFEKVHIGPHREIKWNDKIELCSDSLYLKLTGKTPEELFPKLRRSNPIPEIPI